MFSPATIPFPTASAWRISLPSSSLPDAPDHTNEGGPALGQRASGRGEGLDRGAEKGVAPPYWTVESLLGLCGDFSLMIVLGSTAWTIRLRRGD